MLTGYFYYNLRDYPDRAAPGLLALSGENEDLARSLSLLTGSMQDLDGTAGLRLPEGLVFENLLRPGAGFLSLGNGFRLANPDGAGQTGGINANRFSEAEGIKIPPRGSAADPLSGTVRPSREARDDFKYLCRMFGERYAAVEAFDINNTMTFVPCAGAGGDNVLGYQLLELVMRLRYEAPVTAFFELVKNKGGNNYCLYWEALPDIFGQPETGEARGCTLFFEALAIRGLVSDDARAAKRLPAILPTIERLSAFLRRLYRREGASFSCAGPYRVRPTRQPDRR